MLIFVLLAAGGLERWFARPLTGVGRQQVTRNRHSFRNGGHGRRSSMTMGAAARRGAAARSSDGRGAVYSARNVLTRSNRAARHAGTPHATIATTTNNATTTT